jgi:hypothetical protein
MQIRLRGKGGQKPDLIVNGENYHFSSFLFFFPMFDSIFVGFLIILLVPEDTKKNKFKFNWIF